MVSKDESGNQLSLICEIDPGFFRECDGLVRNLQGRLEILAVSVHAEGDTHVEQYDEEFQPSKPMLPKESDEPVCELSDRLKKQSVSTSSGNSGKEGKQSKAALAMQ